MIRIALAGNPNCGKTTLFNSLTGATAHVGNWPGVTVEKRSGVYRDKGDKTKANEIEVVDLPGIYSLSPYTPEEVISRNYILNEKPDVVVNVVDGTNLERNLYMTTQILEMDVPVVIAINMVDALKDLNLSIDFAELEKAFGVPVIGISALRNKNLKELMAKVREVASTKRVGHTVLDLPLIEKAKDVYVSHEVASPLFHAIKALEKDELEEQENKEAYEGVLSSIEEGADYEAQIADARYVYLTPLCAKAVSGRETKEKDKLSKSDRIDRVLTHRVFGIIIAAVILFLIFHLTFSEDLFYLGAMGVDFGEGYQGLIAIDFGDGELYHPFADLFYSADGINSPGAILANLVNGINDLINNAVNVGLTNAGAAEWAVGFVCDGVLGGVFAVLGFVPQILVLFAFFSFLEDSGYMARVAFIIDRIFRKLGISGRAILPMVMGFGCGIPAMMNTRTLASDKERIKTIRVIPFFTCGAKNEFILMVAAVVGAVINWQPDLFALLIYVFGITIAFIAVIVMNKTTLREKTPPFIMELPAYHRPQLRAFLLHIWDKAKHFIKKAFTIILLSTVFVWIFSHFTWDWQFISDADGKTSILGGLGSFLSPLFVPLGFGNVQCGEYAWTFTVGSIEGIVAKENVTGVLETLALGYDFESFDDLVAASGISTAGLVAFTVFNMLTIPCFASVATAKGELPNRRTYWLTILFWLGVSYGVGALTYITLEWAWTLAITLPLIAGAGVGLYFYDRHMKALEKKAEEAEEARLAA